MTSNLKFFTLLALLPPLLILALSPTTSKQQTELAREPLSSVQDFHKLEGQLLEALRSVGKRQQVNGTGNGHKFVERNHDEWRQQPASNEEPGWADFDKIIDRILQLAGLEDLQPTSIQQQQQQPEAASKVHADANNKTTMRFFRNNKTFASIVYTNEHGQPSGSRKPRRLINCHLVDLERHSPDVTLFESKYEIKTIDVEFKEMMQLIDQCTNIARFKPLGRPGHPAGQANNHQPGLHPNVAQLFAASLPDRNSYAATGGAGHKHPSNAYSTAFRPFLVVGRPSPIPAAANPGFLTPANSKSVAQYPQLSYAPGPTPPPPATAFHSIMSSSLNHELRKLPPVVDDSDKLDLPSSGNKGSGRHLHQRSYNPSVSIAGHGSSHSVAANLLAKARETSKKLVLGEVTPAPSLVDGHQGGIKEALQEITSYDTTDLLAIWRGILPGTNWCGMGDRATSYNDLGFESDIDICCRAHDFCPIRLSAFSGGYGLFNWSFYTRSHCWCDQNFLDCLQRAQSPLSAVVMKFYFTIMKTTCLHDNETTLVYANNQNNNQQQAFFPNPGGGRQRVAPMELPGAGNGPNGSGNNKNKQIPPMQHNNPAQQRLLLEQIRATMPIPALTQSQVVQSRVEARAG